MINLNKNLATRESAKKLFPELKNKNITELDFDSVLIVSRSFANEFINLEKESNFSVKKLNMKPEIKEMFDNAHKILDSNILNKNKYTTISVEKYADMI